MPKSKSHKRSRQVAELIQHQVALIFRKELADPLFMHLTIREVELSPDLSNAKVYVTLFDDVNKVKVMEVLKDLTPKVRHYLAQRTVLRYVPRLRFVYDDTAEKAARIEALLKDQKDDTADNE